MNLDNIIVDRIFLKVEIWIVFFFLDSDVGILVSLCLGFFDLSFMIGMCYVRALFPSGFFSNMIPSEIFFLQIIVFV